MTPAREKFLCQATTRVRRLQWGSKVLTFRGRLQRKVRRYCADETAIRNRTLTPAGTAVLAQKIARYGGMSCIQPDHGGAGR